jgi:hypothetical protein
VVVSVFMGEFLQKFHVVFILAWILQAFKCIFMGNGFWMATNKKKKAGIGKINGLTHITPSTIAYAVAQVCFSFPLIPFIELIKGTFRSIIMRGVGCGRRAVHTPRILSNNHGALRR